MSSGSIPNPSEYEVITPWVVNFLEWERTLGLRFSARARVEMMNALEYYSFECLLFDSDRHVRKNLGREKDPTSLYRFRVAMERFIEATREVSRDDTIQKHLFRLWIESKRLPIIGVAPFDKDWHRTRYVERAHILENRWVGLTLEELTARLANFKVVLDAMPERLQHDHQHPWNNFVQNLAVVVRVAGGEVSIRSIVDPDDPDESESSFVTFVRSASRLAEIGLPEKWRQDRPSSAAWAVAVRRALSRRTS